MHVRSPAVNLGQAPKHSHPCGKQDASLHDSFKNLLKQVAPLHVTSIQSSCVVALQSTLLALWLALCRHAAVLQSSVVACLLLADSAPIHGRAAFSVLSVWVDMRQVSPNFLVTVLVFGLSVQDVLNDSTTSKIERDLDVVDLFCGRAAIHRAAASQGLASVSFDRSRIPGTTDCGLADETEDMSTLEGFMRALRLVLRLRRGGLLAMGPP